MCAHTSAFTHVTPRIGTSALGFEASISRISRREWNQRWTSWVGGRKSPISISPSGKYVFRGTDPNQQAWEKEQKMEEGATSDGTQSISSSPGRHLLISSGVFAYAGKRSDEFLRFLSLGQSLAVVSPQIHLAQLDIAQPRSFGPKRMKRKEQCNSLFSPFAEHRWSQSHSSDWKPTKHTRFVWFFSSSSSFRLLHTALSCFLFFFLFFLCFLFFFPVFSLFCPPAPTCNDWFSSFPHAQAMHLQHLHSLTCFIFYLVSLLTCWIGHFTSVAARRATTSTAGFWLPSASHNNVFSFFPSLMLLYDHPPTTTTCSFSHFMWMEGWPWNMLPFCFFCDQHPLLCLLLPIGPLRLFLTSCGFPVTVADPFYSLESVSHCSASASHCLLRLSSSSVFHPLDPGEEFKEERRCWWLWDEEQAQEELLVDVQLLFSVLFLSALQFNDRACNHNKMSKERIIAPNPEKSDKGINLVLFLLSVSPDFLALSGPNDEYEHNRPLPQWQNWSKNTETKQEKEVTGSFRQREREMTNTP